MRSVHEYTSGFPSIYVCITTIALNLLYKKRKKKTKETIACQHSLWNTHVAIQFWPASDLDLMHALASDALEDVGGALFHYRLELSGTLDKQESSKPKRKPLARQCEHVNVVPSPEDIHVSQRDS